MAQDLDHSVPWLAAVDPEELRRIIDALYRIHQFIAVITDLDTLLEHIMEEGKHVAQAEACSLMLYDEPTEELYFEVALGEKGDQQALKKEIRLKLTEGIAGAAASSRESINVPDVQSDPRFYPQADALTQFKTRSVVAIPLIDREKLVGVFELVNKTDGDPFTETDLRVMEIFSALVATVIANARLIDANLRAAQLAAVGAAVAGLSHYAKNIVAGMGGSIDLIDQGLRRGDESFLRRTWPVLKRSMRRICNLVEDMLAYSKPRRPDARECELRPLIDEVCETFWGLLVRKRLVLDVDLDGITQPVYLNRESLYRCLLNLLINAGDAVPDGTGKIGVRAEMTEDGWLAIEVADNGPGIPLTDRDRVFGLFYSTKGSQGTGLGLAVTHKIIAEHGGNIRISESPDGGALVRILLPQNKDKE